MNKKDVLSEKKLIYMKNAKKTVKRMNEPPRET